MHEKTKWVQRKQQKAFTSSSCTPLKQQLFLKVYMFSGNDIGFHQPRRDKQVVMLFKMLKRDFSGYFIASHGILLKIRTTTSSNSLRESEISQYYMAILFLLINPLVSYICFPSCAWVVFQTQLPHFFGQFCVHLITGFVVVLVLIYTI